MHLLELVQTLHAAAHGLEVGEHAAQPAGVDIVHADALGLFLDGTIIYEIICWIAIRI